MQKYVGVKLVEAAPMTRGDYNIMRGWTIPADEDPNDEGYQVVYSSGYVSWCPKDEFEKQNKQLFKQDNRISQEDVDSWIKQLKIEEIEAPGTGAKITVVTATLANGFSITESATCVDPENYDVDLGVLSCMERIESKVWFLLGFLLASGANGFTVKGA